MCEISLRPLAKNRLPKFTYKVVQKLDEGKYLTTIAGQLLLMNRWATAKDVNLFSTYDPERKDSSVKLYPPDVTTDFNLSLSSWFSSSNNKKFASFLLREHAENSMLLANFEDSKTWHRFPQVLVKCRTGKVAWEAYQAGVASIVRIPVILSQRIRIVEELNIMKQCVA